MARREFTVGQRVMVKIWSNQRSGDNWEEREVVHPVGRLQGYGWTKTHKAEEPLRGGTAYVGVKVPNDDSTWVRWVVNARNKIVSMAEYEPIAEARSARAQAEVRFAEQRAQLKRERFTAMAKFAHKFSHVEDLIAFLGAHFHLSYEGERKADELIEKTRAWRA